MPGEFLTKLILEDRCTNKMRWVLHSPLTYYTEAGEFITAPAGFKTDLASIPRPIQVLLPPIGRYDRAAVIHDLLYTTHAVENRAISKAEADDIFLEALLVCKVNKIKAYSMYLAVSLFGYSSWRK